jgi:long-chain acyl-CoA synthetase
MSLHPDETTLANIRSARTNKGVPPDHYSVPYTSLGDLLERRAAETPDKVFLIHYDTDGNREEITYSAFHARVNQIAHYLIKIGVKRGDRIATIGYNHSDTVMMYFACWKAGIAVAPQNVAEDDERIGYIIRNTEAVVAFVRPEYLERAETIIHGATPIEGVRQIIQIGGQKSGGYPHLQTEIADLPASFRPAESITQEDECLLVYTSGTTGAPKGVVLLHYNLLVDAQSLSEWHRIDAEQRMMNVLPIHHMNGILVTLITPLYVGGSVVLNRAYSSSTFWQRLAREKVQVISVVPTLLQFSLEYAEKAEAEGRSIWGEGVKREDLAGFRHLICGAGTLAVALATRFEEKFGFRIMHGYGLSETTCYSCFLPLDLSDAEHAKWMREYGYPSIGVPIDCNEMAIFDPLGEGKRQAPGERGEICIRGHNVMKYYFQRPDANKETFKFQWFRSGDEGFYEVDDQGRPFFFISGRLKELINRGGVKFSPFDIEEVMLELPQVSIALAVAFENDYYGEEVGAYIMLNEGAALTAEEVMAHCRKRMNFEKSPKVVLFGKDVPVTATGKYQRLKLQPLFAEWKGTQFRP